jgi:hypothetical protein
MGRTIGAAIGALIVVLFFATVKTQGRNSASSATVSTSAQNTTAAKPAADVPATPRHAH